MKAQISTTILTFCFLSVVEGFRFKDFHANGWADYKERVINGANADPDTLPFLVQLQRGRNGLCGGTIISESYILTAAQCVYQTRCLGTKIFSHSSFIRNIPEIHVARCISHPTYNARDFGGDIALILTVERLVTVLRLAAIPLATSAAAYPPGTGGVIPGWGKTQDSVFPGRIREGYVMVASFNSCRAAYKNANQCIGGGRCPVRELTVKSWCTIGKNPRPVSACDGDFGGPLIIDGYVAGVMSGAIIRNGRCKEGSPTLHTVVAEFLPWILNHLL